ncbi:transglycosylase domain-containing protein [Actinomadura flavalba]|uniref:transglycosylase domain-containing protein n=1 Tax=Actinomadura flavalba TaxID=1120938 RepID=UPI00036EC7D8|nr:transglycosylase domain-containing protein [Actinomadura flavalba]
MPPPNGGPGRPPGGPNGPGRPTGGGPGGPGGPRRPNGPGGPNGPDGPNKPGDDFWGDAERAPKGRRNETDPEKTGWRRYVPSWKIVAIAAAVLLLAVCTLVGVAYASTPVPSGTQASATAQETVIYYRDGKTVLARLGTKREDVEFKQIPKHVRDAVLAAEDRTFYTDGGVSPVGIAKAMFRSAAGGEVQGGSTITQQFARNYYAGLSQERSLSRKFKEILISVRVDSELDKDEILKRYLNTIAFGRQAYGIQAASRAYFKKDVSKLSVAEGAMLAAMIQRPSYFVTQGDDDLPAKKALVSRWNYVLDGMVTEGWLDSATRAKQKFPPTARKWSDVRESPQTGYLKERVLDELKDLGIDEQAMSQGMRITTTFDPKLQNYMHELISQLKRQKNLGKDVRFGMASVDPKTGGVVAAYGGPGYEKQQFDDSFHGAPQPGSSFKPIVLATALDQGVSLNTTLNGAYKRTIGNWTGTNDARHENGVYNLLQMTQMSINTAYVDLGQKVGLEKVVKMAKDMGVPADTPGLSPEITALPLGTAGVSAKNMASVYSTFANEGKHIKAHVISKITDADGKVAKRLPYKEQEVFSPAVAGDATKAMRAVVTSGTGRGANLGSRPVAGKTGTTDRNRAAWFVGYTPQYATSVAMWRQNKKGGLESLTGVGGYNQIYGGTVPADAFKQFMLKAHEDEEILPLPTPGNVGKIATWAAPKPRPTRTATPRPERTPMCRPGQESSEDEPCKPRPSDSPSPRPSGTPTAQPTPCVRPGYPEGCTPTTPQPTQPAEPPWCEDDPDRPGCSQRREGE